MNAKYVLEYRRKREGRTNYKKRLALLKSGIPRLTIRRSNKHLTLQLITYHPDGDKVVATLNSKTLIKHGWKHSTKSIPAAYLTGVLLGRLGTEKKVKEAIADIGFHKHIPGSRICAALKGVLDGGIKLRVNEDIFPDPDRIAGKHAKGVEQDVAALASKLKITLPSGKQPANKESAATGAQKEKVAS